MARTQVRYYPVGDGSMTLIKLDDANKTTILIDMCVSNAADDKENRDVYDAAKDIRQHLVKKGDGHLHLNLLINSHGDDDHIHGLQNHFWLGDPLEYKNEEGEPEKIIIDEIWSSTRYRKYATENFPLGDDAKALSKEIRRRVDALDDSDGNYARIVGDELLDDDEDVIPTQVRYARGSCVNTVAGKAIKDFSIKILGPLKKEKDEDDESFNDKNRGSIVIRVDRTVGDLWGKSCTMSLVFGDDTEVRTWERLKELGEREELAYDLLLAPHHCSWHSLSHDHAEDEDAAVSPSAKAALNNARKGAYIILSCLSDEDEGDKKKKQGRMKARTVYKGMVDDGHVLCTGESSSGGKPCPIVFELTANGLSKVHNPLAVGISGASVASIGEPQPHG